MSLINMTNAWLSFSDAPLLDHAELHIEKNERVCLVGRNGAGKSTLLKILNKEIPLDDGQIIYAQDLVVSRLQQDPPRNIDGTIFDFVSEGVSHQAEQLKKYHHLLKEIEQDPSENNLKRLSQLQEQLEQQGIWQIDNRINSVLMQLGLNADAQLSSLSGGWLRKAALARALVCAPQVLLLDEPTNHLDVEAINWLESFLKEFQGSIVFISHDRSFIRAMATRIVDLDRGKLVSWPGDYDNYVAGKEEALRIEDLQNAEFDKKLAQEEVWIRQGIKARRTRNEGRVRALKEMRRRHAERRQVSGAAKMQVEESLRSGKLVFELEDVNYQVGGCTLIKDFSAQVMRGDRIALIGPNGCGKTTLIKLMLQQLQPDTGNVRHGTRLDIAYFDQHRAELDLDKTVVDNLAEGKQEITVAGRTRHVLGYLQDFLFPPKRALTPVKALSGGERNRLLLARLFLKPSNLLILDEPTNDLDVETLELLEELLNEYAGTVILVSHDRQFVDNCVTDCWIFEGNGIIGIYAGGYTDANQQRLTAKSYTYNANRNTKSAPDIDTKHPNKSEQPKKIQNRTKLSYNQKRELEQLPIKIEQLELKISELQAQVSAPDFFTQPHGVTQMILTELSLVEAEMEETFQRWETLEMLKNS